MKDKIKRRKFFSIFGILGLSFLFPKALLANKIDRKKTEGPDWDSFEGFWLPPPLKDNEAYIAVVTKKEGKIDYYCRGVNFQGCPERRWQRIHRTGQKLMKWLRAKDYHDGTGGDCQQEWIMERLGHQEDEEYGMKKFDIKKSLETDRNMSVMH